MYPKSKPEKENRNMWEKIKESRFGKACREFSKRKGAVATVVCLIIALAVVMTVSIAANRAKKNELKEDISADDSTTAEEKTTQGQLTPPTYNDGKTDDVSGDADEEFMLALPVEGILSKGHDSTIQVWSDTMGDYRVHLGVDIESKENAPVYAAADGEVARVWDDALMGKCVAISHDGEIFTIYKNLSATLADGIEKGSRVSCGQKIGYVGESAISELAQEPHLHLEMTVNGLSVNPMDYFDAKAKEKMGVKTDDGTQNGK